MAILDPTQPFEGYHWPTYKASARVFFFSLPCPLVHDVVPCFLVQSHPCWLCYICHVSCFRILFYVVHLSFGRSTLWSSAFQSPEGVLGICLVTFFLMWENKNKKQKTKNRILFLSDSAKYWRIFVFLILSRRDTPWFFLSTSFWRQGAYFHLPFQGPGFCPVEEGYEHYGSVEFNFGVSLYVFSFPYRLKFWTAPRAFPILLLTSSVQLPFWDMVPPK